MEQQFEEFVLQLQPKLSYMRLYREIVTDVWRKSQGDSQKVQDVVVAQESESFGKTKTSWKRRSSISRALTRTHTSEMRTKLTEELTLAEMELRDAQAEEIEIEAVLDFAEMILLNASNLWKAAPAEQKQRLQQVLFPEGVTYSEGKYRTAVTAYFSME